ncbi:DUF2092 domain-containing protein [uncultured Microbulbifer sp.]|uniref:DUF2092 domain-containing protein n=1 Tax=uncultured Microbulbifer sp. TaxID=348147 RepID=UPI0025DB8ED2|nr:DUF2092 domain-containing protein [uncultured Microbulbifer sp.]
MALLGPLSWAQQDAATDKVNTVATAEAIQIVRALEKHLSGKSRLAYETEFTSDVVLDNGQKIQIAGTTRVYFKRPNQLMVELHSDSLSRLLYHDGTLLTVIAPEEKYYGTIAASTSSIDALMGAAKEYGLEIPLVDLIAWGVKGTDALPVESAVYIGESELQGEKVDHWAFRGPQQDWEVWVTREEEPLPLKISTVSYRAFGQPRFTATINWQERTSITDKLFVPDIDKDFHKIPFKKLNPAKAPTAREVEND